MTGRLEPQPWMTDADTVAVLDALASAGATARFVGGCVRDAVLGRSIRDIDIATDALPDDIIAALRRRRIKVVPTGLSHGTVTAIVGGTPFEITTLRHDVETDGRHATVDFTDDWDADASRRDFTFNALSLERDGTLHDPFGGIADLHAGRVRFVGDPQQRLTEDVLRLLRFFRFHAHYGKGAPDPEGLAACRAMAPALTRLSAERVHAELSKLFQAPDPVPAVRAMVGSGAARVVLREPLDVDRLGRMVACEAEAAARHSAFIAPKTVRRLAALLPMDSAAAAEIARKLKVSNADRDRLVALVEPDTEMAAGMKARTVRRMLYRHGAERFADWALYLWSVSGDCGDRGDWLDLIGIAAGWQRPRFPVSGADVHALGVATGPAVGRLLSAVEDWWIESDFAPDRAACLAELKRRAAGIS
jgi:poly(A) polymerase